MAEVGTTAPEPGMVQCQAPGCSNWFKRASGRHAYCKQDGCTYKRGAPPQRPLELPDEESAAAELLRRLQEDEEAEVGPPMLVQRVKAVQVAMRAGDQASLFGALIDVGTCVVWWADRARRGEAVRPVLEAVPQPRPASAPPVGMVQAVVASHQRTFVLAERRVELVWTLIDRRDALEAAKAAGEGVDAAQAAYDAAQRALTSVEGAWRERGETLRQLEGASRARPVAVG